MSRPKAPPAVVETDDAALDEVETDAALDTEPPPAEAPVFRSEPTTVEIKAVRESHCVHGEDGQILVLPLGRGVVIPIRSVANYQRELERLFDSGAVEVS